MSIRVTDDRAENILEYLASTKEDPDAGVIRIGYTLWSEAYLFDITISTRAYPDRCRELLGLVDKTMRTQFWSAVEKRAETVASYRYWFYVKRFGNHTQGRYAGEVFAYNDLDTAVRVFMVEIESSTQRAKEAVKELVGYKSQVTKALSEKEDSKYYEMVWRKKLEETTMAMVIMREELDTLRKMVTATPVNARIRKTVPFTGIHDYTQPRIKVGRKHED